MCELQHYENAPITEAIIDLRVARCAELTIEKLKTSCDKIITEYPNIEPQFEVSGKIEVQPGVSASTSAQQEQIGYRCTSKDWKYICQSRINGLTFSRLAPYESWQPFRDKAKQCWDNYRNSTKPTEITRLAVRYINRIDIPHQTVELKDYFRTSPEVPPDMSKSIAGFFTQLRIRQNDIAAQLLLNQAVVPSSHEGVTSIILDLDLFRENDVPQDEPEIWAFFETLHARKNDLFESCITDKTRELFTPCHS